jgi:hypothetical protein
MPFPRRLRRLAVLALLCVPILLASPWRVPADAAENAEVGKRKAAQRTSFSDKEIVDGFFKVSFGAELGLRGRVDRIRKFAKPVRIYAESEAKPDRRAALAAVVADIRAHIAGLDIAMTDDREQANVIVKLVRDRDLARTVSAIYGDAGRRIVKSLQPQCLSGFSKDAEYRIVQSNVILAADVRDFIFLDCAYEELLQALGPIRDDSSVPWTMFNDDVQKGFFDVYDQYLLNIHYDPSIRAGMTKAEVRAVLPDVLPRVRAFVRRVNGLDR